LAERGTDVLLLAEHFLRRACADYGLAPKTLTADARSVLLAHAWPGNVRELANTMERVALLADTSVVDSATLRLPEASVIEAKPPADRGRSPPLREALGSVERVHLIDALSETRWNIARAAARLGIPRGTLRYRIEKLGLRPGPSREPDSVREPSSSRESMVA